MSHRNRYSKEEWLDMIRDCKSSGLSDQEWCREHHLSRTTFYKHLKQFHMTAGDNGGHLPVKNLPPIPEEHEILPLIITDEPSLQVSDPLPVKDQCRTTPSFIPAIRVTVGNITYEISNEASSSLVAETLRSLQLS